jgi:thiol-disulfide isomerase/thioredoxin
VSWLAAEREQGALLARRVRADGRRGGERVVARLRVDRAAGFPRMERLGDRLAFAWTDVDARRLRAALVPLASVPAAGGDEPPPAPADPTGPVAGAPAPDYRAATLDGAPVALGSLAGKAVLLNVWATWCEPCRQELPELAALHGRHPGLEIVAVSVDRGRSPDEIRELAARRGLPFAIWHDRDDDASRVFGIGALPATFLIDRRGVLVWRRDGAITAADPELAAAIVAATR